MSNVLDGINLLQSHATPSDCRAVVISDFTGREIFRQDRVLVPKSWSDTAVKIAVSRWFRGKLGTEEREDAIHQMFHRVASSLSQFGQENGYFSNDEESEGAYQTLMQLQLDQKVVFNTPVYLNAGWNANPRCSACFLIHVEDNYESLTEHAVVEGRVFQHGGGAGLSLSHISHEGRLLGRGGEASGPLTFNEGWDRSAGAIKSGGANRRAARDVTLDVRHPDCYRSPEYIATLKHAPLDVDFIREKMVYENIRKDLAGLGHEVGMNSLIDYVLPAQNANRAVGVYDDFMQAVLEQRDWDVCCPRSGEKVWTYPAKEIWDAICYATWASADPTIKFLDTINRWNTTPRGELLVDGVLKKFDNLKIDKSNPCNEVVYSVPPVSKALVACNLAMLRLTKYYDAQTGVFDSLQFANDAQLTFMYQDMIVDYSDYPTVLGDQWTRANRIIGISFSDLGGVLMAMGLPYDSDEGRDTAGAMCALLLASGMSMSAKLAEELGPCEAWVWNTEHAHAVMSGHLKNLESLLERTNKNSYGNAYQIASHAYGLMSTALIMAKKTGFRNMQFVSLAPQGTTGLITDCYSTGPEPLYALRSFKTLSGGGMLTQTPECVSDALLSHIENNKEMWRDRCWSSEWHGKKHEIPVDAITTSMILEWATYELLEYGESSVLDSREIRIFETAGGVWSKSRNKSVLALSPEAHIDMLAALQPFVSGAISKTVNLPNSATVEDVSDLYIRAWERGVKAVAVYRDGSKGAQVLSTKAEDDEGTEDLIDGAEKLALQEQIATLQDELARGINATQVLRLKLPADVASIRKRIVLSGHKVYLHIGLYPDGSVGEIYLTGVQGSFLSGMLDSFAILVSFGLQYGIPFESLYRKFEATEFSPNGFLPNIGFAASFPAAIMKTLKKGIEDGEFRRYAEAFYIHSDDIDEDDDGDDTEEDTGAKGVVREEVKFFDSDSTPTGEPCWNCGTLMFQSGRCKYCPSCGANAGGCG